jgi:hypothetical protein
VVVGNKVAEKHDAAFSQYKQQDDRSSHVRPLNLGIVDWDAGVALAEHLRG